MNNVTPDQKQSVLKMLAIAGFIGIIILIAWAAMQIVHVLPSAFASLASIADSVYNRGSSPTTINVSASDTEIATNDTVTVTWEQATVPGSYTFSYACSNDLSVTAIEMGGERSLTCGTTYNVGTVNELVLKALSPSVRFADVEYSIGFLRTNDTSPRATGSGSFTVINSTIADNVPTDTVTTNDPVPDQETDTSNPVPPSDEVSKPAPITATPPNNVPTKPSTPTIEYTYAIPVSDPNGQTDLAVRFLSFGRISDGRFITSPLRTGRGGAIQFEVRNIGTKTSAAWTYTVDLPGADYTSPKQTVLKPNERAVITVGFPDTDVTRHTFQIRTETTGDRSQTNNRITTIGTFE
jgi:hypothetical protein